VSGEVTIYRVVCRPTGEAYVGSTRQRIEARFGHHRSRLNAGWHRSRRLQAAWRKFGERAFEFSVVEVVPERERSVAEWRAMQNCRSTFNSLDERGVRR
jgi:predicted GIY-YIG superfamily endonuclease